MEYHLTFFMADFPPTYGVFSGMGERMHNRGINGPSHRLVHEYSEDIIVAE